MTTLDTIALATAVIAGFAWSILKSRYSNSKSLLVLQTAIAVLAVVWLLKVIGLSSTGQALAAAVIPTIRLWLWLTRRWTYVLMPINAAMLGAALASVAAANPSSWQSAWLHLVADIPGLSNLSAVLGFLPLTMLMWAWIVRRWPRLTKLPNLLILGGLLWFVFLRLSTNWLPMWYDWFGSFPFLRATPGPFIFLFPLCVWLWWRGLISFPVYTRIFNLLFVGGILGLIIFHTRLQTSTLKHELPFERALLLAVSLGPLVLWIWLKMSQQWPEFLVVPNLLIVGCLGWFVLDKTRLAWQGQWISIWDSMPFALDPAGLMLPLPLAVRIWRRGVSRWPTSWGIVRALTVGIFLLVIVIRVHPMLQHQWPEIAHWPSMAIPAAAFASPICLWLTRRFAKR